MRFHSIPVFPGIFLILMMSVAPAFSQGTSGEVGSGAVARIFDPLYRTDARLISGNIYQDPTPMSTEGTPYAGNGEWNTGSVVIRGIRFDSVQLKYDIYTNSLIINTLNFNNLPFQVALNKENVSSFTLNGKKYIPFPSTDSKAARTFCQVLSEGTSTLLLVQTKSLIVPANGMSKYNYDTFSRMYLLTGEKCEIYKGKLVLFRLYPNLRSRLENYIRTEKLKFRAGKFESHAKLIDYCNQLLSENK